MRDLVSWQSGWSSFGFVLLIVVLVMSLVSLLIFLEFDLETSPAWQVVIYHGMLSIFLSLTFVVASFPPLYQGQRLRWFLVALALLVPVVVFFTGWILTGSYSGFRDDRIFDLMVVSVSGFMLIWMFIWMFIIFPLVGFLFVRDLVRLRRRGAPGNERSS